MIRTLEQLIQTLEKIQNSWFKRPRNYGTEQLVVKHMFCWFWRLVTYLILIHGLSYRVWRDFMVSFVLHTIKYCSYIGNFSCGHSCAFSLLLPRILQHLVVFYNNYKLQYILFFSVAYFRVSILNTTKVTVYYCRYAWPCPCSACTSTH